MDKAEPRDGMAAVDKPLQSKRLMAGTALLTCWFKSAVHSTHHNACCEWWVTREDALHPPYGLNAAFEAQIPAELRAFYDAWRQR